MIRLLVIMLIVIPLIGVGQVVEERIQIDTLIRTIQVIYKPEISRTYYTQKVAVFANDTAQIAVEKSFTKNGQNGLYKAYYPSGRLMIKTVFANNQINGEWTYYDPNGIIIIKGIYENGIKDGYWAYKSLKIYGRYKDGLKNKKWKRFDQGENKHLSHYKNGVLTGGEGFGAESPVIMYVVPAKDSIIADADGGGIDKEYQEAIAFLRQNVRFKKELKAYLGQGDLKNIRSLKKYFKKNEFQFNIDSRIIGLDLSKFMEYSEKEQLESAQIDSVIKTHASELVYSQHGKAMAKNDQLYRYGTVQDSAHPISVFFSPVEFQLLRIDVVWNKSAERLKKGETPSEPITDQEKFQLLLYFNVAGKLKGAAYERP